MKPPTVNRKLNTVINSMSHYKAVQAQERLSCGDQWRGEGHIFTQWDGKPMHPDTLSRWFKKFVNKQNQSVLMDSETTPEQKAGLLFPELSIHGLRHTNASLLIANGANIRTVAARLGHAQVSTTTNIYSHAIKTADALASDALEGVLLKRHG